LSNVPSSPKEVSELLAAKDEIIRQKDEIIRLKDELILSLFKAKNDRIRTQEGRIRAQQERILSLTKSKDDATRYQEGRVHTLTESVREAERTKIEHWNNFCLGNKNAKLMKRQDRLSLKHAVEDYENKAKDSMNDPTETNTRMGGNDSTREATWYEILQSNMDQIVTLLVDEDRPMTADEVKKWVAVALDLHRISSTVHIHNISFVDALVTVDKGLLTADALKLAVAVCKKLPVGYDVVPRWYEPRSK
jgi:hypothetical protein